MAGHDERQRVARQRAAHRPSRAGVSNSRRQPGVAAGLARGDLAGLEQHPPLEVAEPVEPRAPVSTAGGGGGEEPAHRLRQGGRLGDHPNLPEAPRLDLLGGAAAPDRQRLGAVVDHPHLPHRGLVSRAERSAQSRVHLLSS